MNVTSKSSLLDENDRKKLDKISSNSGKYAKFVLDLCLVKSEVEREFVLKIKIKCPITCRPCICTQTSHLIPLKPYDSYERITYTLPFIELIDEDQQVLKEVFSSRYSTPMTNINFKFRRTVTDGKQYCDGKLVRREEKLLMGIKYSDANEVSLPNEMIECLERSDLSIDANRRLKIVRCVEYLDKTVNWQNELAPFIENTRLSIEIRGQKAHACVEIEMSNLFESEKHLNQRDQILSLLPVLLSDYQTRHSNCINGR